MLKRGNGKERGSRHFNKEKKDEKAKERRKNWRKKLRVCVSSFILEENGNLRNLDERECPKEITIEI